MTTADLLLIKPKQVDNEIKIEVTFAKNAKWVPTTLLKTKIDIHTWLRFLEDCFTQFEIPTHPITPGFFTIEIMKSQYKLIGGGTHAFVIPKTKWKRFIEEQAEKLYLSGIITLEEPEPSKKKKA